MRTFLLLFLKSLEAAIPPPENCHHAITFARFGSDAAGWQDRLALQVNRADVFYCLFIDDEDFSRGVGSLVELVVEQLSLPMEGEQLGVALGRYV
jgi:hypothetical protein